MTQSGIFERMLWVLGEYEILQQIYNAMHMSAKALYGLTHFKTPDNLQLMLLQVEQISITNINTRNLFALQQFNFT